MDSYFGDPFNRRPPQHREGYDVAQICLNGHCVNSSSQGLPDHNEDHCSKCGQPTITACPKCNTKIRGYYWGGFSDYLVPSFCHECGAPYPWTETKLSVAIEMAKELDSLDGDERAQLAGSIDDLVRESPKTNLAAMRFKKLMSKAGSAAAESLRKILVDIASETAKKIIWPDAK